MTTAALLLVLSSGVLHASWNFLVKRSGHKVVFFWVMAAVGLPIVAGPAVYFAVRDDFGWTQLGYCAVTSTLHALYAIFLTRGYYLGDLSSVYPVSRGIGPAFVPVLAVIFLDESVSAEAIVGIGLVVAGILAIQVDRRLLADLSHPCAADVARVHDHRQLRRPAAGDAVGPRAGDVAARVGEPPPVDDRRGASRAAGLRAGVDRAQHFEGELHRSLA
jgi:uncharacterized membrane protein